MDWTPQGAGPATEGQVENIRDKEVVGAVNAVAPHPDDANVVYIGAVNGGIWLTQSARADRPTWETLTPGFDSLSIGALVIDASDGETVTIIAGTGRSSSMRRMGGELLGVLRSSDHGATWNTLDNAGLFRHLHIRAIHASNDVIVVSANATGHSGADGVYRTNDGGASWEHLSATQLRRGPSFALASLRAEPGLVYAHAGNAIFRSDDDGASWTRVSSKLIDTLLLGDRRNVRIAAGRGGAVFLAIATSGRLAGLFRSGDFGATWAALDLPTTIEGANQTFGLHPGGQAGIHFSMVADSIDDQVVYIGGDRQPAFNERAPERLRLARWPNSIGAQDYSGRLFRVDARRPVGGQASPLTHSHTRSNSSPHADSRGMAIDMNGDLIECDDGGVYRRTDPGSRHGDWLSMNGNLQTAEFHSASFEPSTQTVIAGAQDTGTQLQRQVDDVRWLSLSTGDGGAVATGPFGTDGGSVRYSSYQYLSGARRDFFDSQGKLLSRQRLQLQEVGSNRRLTPQFYTPIAINRGSPRRLVLGGRDAVWESFDRGDTLRIVDPIGVRINSVAALAYGGETDADTLYVGTGAEIFVRRGPAPERMRRTGTIGTSQEQVTGLTLDPRTPSTAYATFFSSVHVTDDSGETWTDITGDLRAAGAATFRSVTWCGNVGAGKLVVGSNTGVYAAEATELTRWSKLGGALPSAPVLQLQYDELTRTLLASTLGRGAWTISFPEPDIAQSDGDEAGVQTFA